MTVKSWQPVFKMLKTHIGNNIIDPRNKMAIETYNAIEAKAKRELPSVELHTRDKGERV